MNKSTSSKNILLKQSREARKLRKSRDKKKRANILKAKRRKVKHTKPRRSAIYLRTKKEEICIALNPNFSLLEEPDFVIASMNRITTLTNKYADSKVYKIDLSNIIKIDIGAISLLLSKVHELSARYIEVWGNFPMNEHCKSIIVNSGFLDHMKGFFRKGHGSAKKNLIIRRGFDKTSNRKVGEEIRKAVKYLTGEEASYRPVFSMIQEMCANSIEHANSEKNKKNWLLSLHYEDEKVVFTMIDIGKGILTTLKRKAGQIIVDTLKNDIAILDRAFDKIYQSATKDINRNKGLPKIKKINEERYVENLKVITNSVMLDFTNEENSKMLETVLKGTFYYWELTSNTIQKWKTRTLN